ncbi:MAG: anti-sigma factor domain-containing protein [Anaerolineales bacterium]
MNHETELSLGAYALGALGAEERQNVEQHLADCQECQDLVTEYMGIAEGLLHSAPHEAPSAGLRVHLDSRIAGRATRQGLSRARRLLRTPQAALVAVATLLIIVNLGVLFRTLAIAEEGKTLLDQQRAGQTALALASYPTSRVITIHEGSAAGTLVYDPGFPVAVLSTWGLEELPHHQAYQLWLVNQDGTRSSGALFSPAGTQDFVSVLVESPIPIGEYRGFGVTVEPAQGSAEPSGPPILSGDFYE